ncbi:hypothetical protein RRG08_010071 [Elysia crispata]|uniref:Uncharacterized protein n=1 Tax=Elysia crispata TaxID=231223 RepID=A0AAE1B9N4_9GAST|nr:hypothetical protein RRG08_010071 [Elysia crispata]
MVNRVGQLEKRGLQVSKSPVIPIEVSTTKDGQYRRHSGSGLITPFQGIKSQSLATAAAVLVSARVKAYIVLDCMSGSKLAASRSAHRTRIQIELAIRRWWRITAALLRCEWLKLLQLYDLFILHTDCTCCARRRFDDKVIHSKA